MEHHGNPEDVMRVFMQGTNFMSTVDEGVHARDEFDELAKFGAAYNSC